MITKKQLRKLIDDKPDCFTQEIKSKKHRNIYNNTYEYIVENYIGINFSEKCYRFLNKNVNDKCIICGSKTRYMTITKGFKKYCSKKCIYLDLNRVKKIKNTKLERYDDKNYNNQEKNKQTKLKNHGDENYNNQEKARKTRFERYGDENYGYYGSDFFKLKLKQKYGVEFFAQTKEFREVQSKKLSNKEYQQKMREGIYAKYGVYYIMQSHLHADKCNNYSKWHEYILPSGHIIKLQGYEPYAMNNLISIYDEIDIYYKKRDMPNIWYIENNKKHKYYPDFYIPKDNLIIEVKSEYTLNNSINNIKQKILATLLLNYNIELWVMNKKGLLLNLFKGETWVKNIK